MVGHAQLRTVIINANVHLVGTALSVNVNIICEISFRTVHFRQCNVSCNLECYRVLCKLSSVVGRNKQLVF